VISQD